MDNNNNPIPENNNVAEQPIVQPEPVAQPEPVQSPVFDTPTPSVEIPTPSFDQPSQPAPTDIPPIPTPNQMPNQMPDGQFQQNIPPIPTPPAYGNMPNGQYQAPNPNMNGQNGVPTPPQYNVPQQFYPQAEKPESTNGFAVASMVVGIVSIVSSCFCGGVVIGLVAIILGIVGMVQSNKTGANKGFAIAGIICGAAGFAISLAILILAAVGGISIDNGFNGYDYDDDFARGFEGFINLIKTKLF